MVLIDFFIVVGIKMTMGTVFGWTIPFNNYMTINQIYCNFFILIYQIEFMKSLSSSLSQARAFKFWWTSFVFSPLRMSCSWLAKTLRSVNSSPQSFLKLPTAGRRILQHRPPWQKLQRVTSPFDLACFSTSFQNSKVQGRLEKCKLAGCTLCSVVVPVICCC